MKAFLPLGTIAMLALAACSNSDVVDERLYTAAAKAQEDGICNVHHCPMVKKTVPIIYGLIPGADRNAGVRLKHFPHAEESASGGCVVEAQKTTEIYVCPECKDAQRRWIRMHSFSS